MIPVRASLIQLAEAWDEAGFKGPCLFSFSEEEIEKHNEQLQKYRDIMMVQGIARKLLDTDPEGWISPQLDFAVKARQNKKLLKRLCEKTGSTICRLEKSVGYFVRFEGLCRTAFWRIRAKISRFEQGPRLALVPFQLDLWLNSGPRGFRLYAPGSSASENRVVACETLRRDGL